MGRWTPQVLPEAPRLAPMFDIGSALGEVADGISSYKANQRRDAREQELDDRYYDEQNQRRIDAALGRQRQERLDGIAAGDRQRRNERDYLDTKGRAADDGYVSGGARAERQDMARTLKAGGGMAGIGIGDALLSASSGDESLTLTRPDDTEETLYRDPTMTKEARGEQEWRGRQSYLDRLKPEPADRVGDELREYEGKLKLDQRYRVNDFAPDRRGGGGGAGSGSSNAAALSTADKMFDNADRVVARLEGQRPKAPDYSTWRGGDRPIDTSDPDYPAFKTDSTATAREYDQRLGTWQNKLNSATKKAQEWFSIGDALARQATGASGGDAIFTGQQVNARREIEQASAEFQAAMQQVAADPIARKELQEQFTRDVQAINQKYGIRPRPEE